MKKSEIVRGFEKKDLLKGQTWSESDPIPIFWTISGSHLFGFPSPDSDYDVRGCHIVPTKNALSLDYSEKHLTHEYVIDILPKVEIVSHEVKKLLRLMLVPNVNILEETLSPHILRSSNWHVRMRELAKNCISRKCFGHVRGMTKHTEHHAFEEQFKEPKRNLYLLRILLQGYVMMKHGLLISDIQKLVAQYSLTHTDTNVNKLVSQLIESKFKHEKWQDANWFTTTYTKLIEETEKTYQDSKVREKPECRDKANELLYQMRIAYLRDRGCPE